MQTTGTASEQTARTAYEPVEKAVAIAAAAAWPDQLLDHGNRHILVRMDQPLLLSVTQARVCHMCHSGALCDERHVLLECPALGDLRSQYAPLIGESSGVMAQLVWADDQPLVSKYIIACLDRSEVH